MDELFAKIAADTTKFNLGDEETWRELFEPFYPEPDPSVTVVRNQRYGPAERNHLDVYHPKSDDTEDKPVLIFVHGGGFFSGDKAWSEKCWGNIGYWFAKHGIVTVCATHQLVPHVTYPGGADDMQLCREWVYANISKYSNGSPNKVVLFGHSSGGAHIASNLYAAGDPDRKIASAVFPPVAGVAYFSVPFWFDRTRPIRQRTLRQYFGSDAEDVWGPRSPLGLFKNLPEDSPLFDSAQIPVYIGTVKWEVKEAADAAVAFFNEYRARSKPTGTLPIFHVLDRHNHLSNVLSIGTEDEAQAQMILQFVRSCVPKNSRLQKL